jgi:hypothetical protein
MLRRLFLLLLPAVAAAFMPWPQSQWRSRIYSQNENDKEEEPKLVLDGMENEMNRLKSKFPTSEVDFLAAARKRAQEARESINDSASEEDWLDIASQKQSALQTKDDWEASLNEAGNEESQILIPIEWSSDGEDEEPNLLLL